MDEGDRLIIKVPSDHRPDRFLRRWIGECLPVSTAAYRYLSLLRRILGSFVALRHSLHNLILAYDLKVSVLSFRPLINWRSLFVLAKSRMTVGKRSRVDRASMLRLSFRGITRVEELHVSYRWQTYAKHSAGDPVDCL